MMASPAHALPAEVEEVHTRLLKCALCIEESRAYWAQVTTPNARGSSAERARIAFEESWFGAKSQRWVSVLVTNMRARFDAFPQALRVLSSWRGMRPETRRLICHVHLMLSDPLYRAFTGAYLMAQRQRLRPEVHRAGVIAWVADMGPGRWTVATRAQLATRLLSCALAAGLLERRRDPRTLVFPSIPDDAFAYILYLLRDTAIAGTVLDNPYLGSLGLRGGFLADRLRTCDAVAHYRNVGDSHDIEWRYPDLLAWARVHVAPETGPLLAVARETGS